MPGKNGSGIAVARPNFAVDAQEQPLLGESLLGLLIDETAEGLFRCEASFGNWGAVKGRIGFRYFDRQVLEFGKSFTVDFGPDTLFSGRIMALEAQFPEFDSPFITVLAEDHLQDLRQRRRSRTFVDMDDASIFTQIAQEHSLSSNIELDGGPTHKVLAQVNQSDLAFLRQQARTLDANIWVEDDTLHARKRGDGADDGLSLRFRADLIEFSVLADLARQRTSLTVSGWDIASKRALSHEATATDISSELNGDISGVSILRSAIGERPETIVHHVSGSSDVVQQNATAYFRSRARRFVTGHGVAELNPKLRLGSEVTLEQLGPLFSGKYTVTGVRHLFDGLRGMRTEFSVERPGLGRG